MFSLLEYNKSSTANTLEKSSECTLSMVHPHLLISSLQNPLCSCFLTSPRGPIIRINPFELHVKDPDWYDELYTNNRRRDKSAWFVGRSGGKSIFGTIPHDHHRLRRSALNPFFSKRSIVAIEPLIQDKVNKLCDAVGLYIKSGKPLELQTAYMALTLDVISHYAFGETLRLVEKEGFSPDWKKALLDMIEAGTLNRHLPWLADCLMMLPDSVATAVSTPIAFFLQVQKVSDRSVLDNTAPS